MKHCTICKHELDKGEQTGTQCTNCWEVRKRLPEFLRSASGRQVIYMGLARWAAKDAPYDEKLGRLLKRGDKHKTRKARGVS